MTPPKYPNPKKYLLRASGVDMDSYYAAANELKVHNSDWMNDALRAAVIRQARKREKRGEGKA